MIWICNSDDEISTKQLVTKMTRINVENLIVDRRRIVTNIENMLGCRKNEIENDFDSIMPPTENSEIEYETIIINDDEL